MADLIVEEKILLLNKKSLILEVKLTKSKKVVDLEVEGKEYVIGDLVKFKMSIAQRNKNLAYSVRLSNNRNSDKSKHNATYTHYYKRHDVITSRVHYNIETCKNWFEVEDIYYNANDTRTITVVVTMSTSNALPGNPYMYCASLYDDTELTDFELNAEDGSVRLHKAIAASASPVLRRMFSGEWRETASGELKVTGTRQLTLQHFKDYLYLDKLPNTGLEQLLLLASFYLMKDLEMRCIEMLILELKPENVYTLLEFAVENKMTKLCLRILERVQECQVLVADIRSHCDDDTGDD